jgi:hypothetical protein
MRCGAMLLAFQICNQLFVHFYIDAVTFDQRFQSNSRKPNKPGVAFKVFLLPLKRPLEPSENFPLKLRYFPPLISATPLEIKGKRFRRTNENLRKDSS